MDGSSDYRPASLAREGFIHLSSEAQWLATANRFYRGRADLLLVSIDGDRLRAELRHEPADGDIFPHLYGPLNLNAVDFVSPLPCAATDGSFHLPCHVQLSPAFHARMCAMDDALGETAGCLK